MIRIWTIVFVVVVFVAGVATGVAGERLTHHGRGPPQGFGSRRPPQERLFEELTAELQLTTQQRAQIAAVLDDAQLRARAIMQASRPALDEARNVTRERVVAVLTPEQQAKYLELEKARGPDRGPPDGGPGGSGGWPPPDDRGPPGDDRGPPR